MSSVDVLPIEYRLLSSSMTYCYLLCYLLHVVGWASMWRQYLAGGGACRIQSADYWPAADRDSQ